MSLIPCPACQHLVSPNAKSCPQCGQPIDSLASDLKNVLIPARAGYSPVERFARVAFWWMVPCLLVAHLLVGSGIHITPASFSLGLVLMGLVAWIWCYKLFPAPKG